MVFPDDVRNQFGIVIDAGSSGSRLHIYRWNEYYGSALNSMDDKSQHSVPQLYQSKEWAKKVSPGLSSFEKKPNKAFSHHIKPLLSFAESIIPEDKLRETPVFIQATAGMRLLPEKTQENILRNVCEGIRKSTSFLMKDCKSQVQIIDGETEGIYGWISLNYMTGHFNNYEVTDKEHFTFGFMDMGGASAQIAFVPSDKEELKTHSEDIAKVYLKSINGDIQEWNVFVSTWLGFGANQARQRYWAQIVNALPENTNNYDDDDFSTRTLYDPCMPKNCKHVFNFKGVDFTAIGLGDFDQCSKTIYPLLLKNVPCADEPCLFNGVHTPRIDFNKDKFIGISEYWYTPNDVFKLGGNYDFEQFSTAVKEFCNSDWDTILKNSDEGRYNSIPNEFLIDSCFKSNWILNVLHEGLELPKEKSLRELDDRDKISHPTFQSAGTINDIELSWTLGRMLLFASARLNTGDSLPNVGIVPSKVGMHKFGQVFIAGSIGFDSALGGNSIWPLWRYIFLFSLLTAVIYVSLRKSLWRIVLTNTKVQRFINYIVCLYSRFRARGSFLEPLSQLEEGSINSPEDKTFKMRSKSMFNLNGLRGDKRQFEQEISQLSSPSDTRLNKGLPQEPSMGRSTSNIRTAFSLADFSKFQDRKHLP